MRGCPYSPKTSTSSLITHNVCSPEGLGDQGHAPLPPSQHQREKQKQTPWLLLVFWKIRTRSFCPQRQSPVTTGPKSPLLLLPQALWVLTSLNMCIIIGAAVCLGQALYEGSKLF